MPSSQDPLIDPNSCRGTTIVSINNNITSDPKKSKMDKTIDPNARCGRTNVSINHNITCDLKKSDVHSPKYSGAV